MKLLIDCGNSRMKYVYLNSDSLSKVESLDNDQIDQKTLNQMLNGVSVVCVSSVLDEQLFELISNSALQNGATLIQAKTQAQTNGIVCGYKKPQQMGVDRWLAILGAQHLMPNLNLIIVDAGTATTVDILTSNKRHLGGWILPGVETIHNSITERAANVHSEFKMIDQLSFGVTTQENVNQASWAATLGLISMAKETFVNYFDKNNEKTSDDIQLLFTGGNGKKLMQLYQEFNSEELIFVPELVFHGLKQYC